MTNSGADGSAGPLARLFHAIIFCCRTWLATNAVQTWRVQFQAWEFKKEPKSLRFARWQQTTRTKWLYTVWLNIPCSRRRQRSFSWPALESAASSSSGSYCFIHRGLVSFCSGPLPPTGQMDDKWLACLNDRRWNHSAPAPLSSHMP